MPQAGIALVIVLWIITLLSLIAASFAYAMRSEMAIVGNTLSLAKGAAAADAGIQRAIYELFKPANLAGRWDTNGVPRDWAFGDATVTITMTDESGKIDINTGSDLLLKGLFLTQGVPDDQATALVDAIKDWVDADSLKRLHGAEESEYAAAGLGYKPANAPFLAMEELKLVLGMTPDLYRKIAPYITIYSRLPGVNSQIASRDVLRAIPGVTDEQVDAYLQQRETARQQNAALPSFTVGAAYLSVGSGMMTRIVADAKLNDGTHFLREAVVMKLANPKRPYTYLLWREVRDAPPAATAALAPTGTAGDASTQVR